MLLFLNIVTNCCCFQIFRLKIEFFLTLNVCSCFLRIKKSAQLYFSTSEPNQIESMNQIEFELKTTNATVRVFYENYRIKEEFFSPSRLFESYFQLYHFLRLFACLFMCGQLFF